MAFSIRTGRQARTTAPASRASSSISPLTWMLGAALGAVLAVDAGSGGADVSAAGRDGAGDAGAGARGARATGAATLAGCVALFSGYALFTAYERSAFAELAGGFWIPLVLLFALRDQTRSSRLQALATDSTGPRVAGPRGRRCMALESNRRRDGLLPARGGRAGAVVLERSWAPVLRAAAGAALGMGLVAFYLVPAAWEQRWVDIRQVIEDPGQTLENNWLFAVHADPALAYHDVVLHTVSVIAVIMVALALCRVAGVLAARTLAGRAALVDSSGADSRRRSACCSFLSRGRCGICCPSCGSCSFHGAGWWCWKRRWPSLSPQRCGRAQLRDTGGASQSGAACARALRGDDRLRGKRPLPGVRR